ncbi:MAG: glutamate 5-kinase [Lactobacillales bacterium]|jgi:glutamate 5-kinase|nr:glutamate 5-kinase [Lactobacillales bacterium]
MRNELKNARRIVIKIGTSTLLYDNGTVNLRLIDELAFTITNLMNEGVEVILVTSGAIGVAMGQLRLKTRPREVERQQALAAIGQAELMNIYKQRFNAYTQHVAQVLLTRDVVDYETSRENVSNTLNALLDLGVLAIINENDTVSIDELDHNTAFGDNDTLSVIVSIVANADLLIILSDVDGFYDKNPGDFADAKKYDKITEITPELLNQAGGAGTNVGTGGMLSKLTAAETLLKNDGKLVIALGEDPKIINEILSGENVGTLFAKG